MIQLMGKFVNWILSCLFQSPNISFTSHLLTLNLLQELHRYAFSSLPVELSNLP